MEAEKHIQEFDRKIGELTGLPDVVHTRQATVRYLTDLTGEAQTFIVTTYRQREKGDHIFIEFIGAEGTYRIMIPPSVANLIARQRDQLATKSRKKVARRVADDRKARGEKSALESLTPRQRTAARKKAAATRKKNAAARRARRTS